jgi:N-acetylmuramoyl-L-alanine amidase
MKLLPAVAACLLVAACARLPPSVEGVIQTPSPNFDARRPNYVIIHQTSDDTAEEALATLTNPERMVSAHYLIGRDGALYQLVDERSRAWHAGASWWAGDTDLNSASIGIELDNNGAEPFAEAQIERLLRLLGDLKARYRIPAQNFLGHGDVAPGRKVDPSALFPWGRLAAAGYGLWCNGPPATLRWIGDADVGLRLLGYSLADRAAALAAFRRHFLGVESAAEPDGKDMAVLNCLIQQKYEPPAQP